MVIISKTLKNVHITIDYSTLSHKSFLKCAIEIYFQSVRQLSYQDFKVFNLLLWTSNKYLTGTLGQLKMYCSHNKMKYIIRFTSKLLYILQSIMLWSQVTTNQVLQPLAAIHIKLTQWAQRTVPASGCKKALCGLSKVVASRATTNCGGLWLQKLDLRLEKG